MISQKSVVEKARSAIGHKCLYKLGAGGGTGGLPFAPENPECDCSGFASWVYGVKRKVSVPMYEKWNGGWFETTAIYRDANSPYGFFTKVEEAKPGDVLVWGDSKGKQGHIGIVGQVSEGKPVSVIHCSKGNGIKYGDAIQETSPTVFISNNAIIARWYDMDNTIGKA
jgi:hypothetical protein